MYVTQMLHVWIIYLDLAKNLVNVSTYSIYGAFVLVVAMLVLAKKQDTAKRSHSTWLYTEQEPAGRLMRPVWTGDSEFGNHHVQVGNHHVPVGNHHVQTEPRKKPGLTFH